jgi:hypothetical protein
MQSNLVVLICPCCREEISLEIKADAKMVSAFSISAEDLRNALDQSGYEFGMEGGE